MHRRTTRLLAAALVVVLSVLAVACGDDEDAADTSASSTTTTAASTPCADVYLAGDGAPEGADMIEDRGAPEMTACKPSGELEVIDEVPGNGAEVQPGDTITAQYSGIVASSGTEFDSSWSRGTAATFPLDGVIQGWSEGLVGMKVGGRRTLVIPADLAYGDAPPPGSGIAPGDTLVFTVDLVSIDASANGSATTLPTSTTVAG
jgi:peptidylprolyl isomerase